MLLSYDVHFVTLRVVQTLDESALEKYIKKHKTDADAWRAYFNVSTLDSYDLINNAIRILPKDVTVECACRWAESVLHLFESRYNYLKKPTADAATADAAAAYAAADAAADAAAYARWSEKWTEKYNESLKKQLQTIVDVVRSRYEVT